MYIPPNECPTSTYGASRPAAKSVARGPLRIYEAVRGVVVESLAP